MGKSIKNLSSVTTVGLDIAKNVFQVHGVDAEGALAVAKAVRRGQLLSFFASLPPCVVGIEACSSAHHWLELRELRVTELRCTKLAAQRGHTEMQASASG